MTQETVTLENDQWTQIIDILARTPAAWMTTNPLIQAIGRQLQTQRGVQQQLAGDGHGDINAQRSTAGEGKPAPTGFGAAPSTDANIVRGKRPGNN